MPSEHDRIERSVLIQAPRSRIWRALSHAEEFGDWFGADLRGQAFAAGQRARGPITAPGYEHVFFDVVVQQVDAGKTLSFLWHPYAIDPAVDYGKEQRTLVTFTLQDAPAGGTLLTVVESGFDQLPPARRTEAWRMNTRGWEAQMHHIERHAAAG